MRKTNVLMCGSRLDVKGGMVSVIKNYLGYNNWNNYNLIYVPTHVEKHKMIVTIYFALSLIRIVFILLAGNISIAHLHTAERGSFFRKAILVRLLRKFGVKTVMHHHAAEFEDFYSKLSDKKKRFVNRTFELADVNIVLSKRLVPMITDRAPGVNVKVLYNAVKTYPNNPYNISGQGILFLGRLGKRKGAYDTLKAIKELDNKLDPGIRFYMCGDGEIEQIKDKVKEYKIEHRIAHIGWINADEKEHIFKDTIINILPSYNEGLPMTILETMAYGIPNISTNIASIPEVIFDGENGFMIEPGDVDGLCERITYLLSNNAILSKLSNRSYNLITERFSINNHISELCGIYDGLI